MIKMCKYNQSNVIKNINQGKLDFISLSNSNLIDDIILDMYDKNIFDCLKNNIPDLRKHNTTIPYELIWASSICAKMKVQTSLTDIPFAINNHRTLAKLGYTIIDDKGNLKDGLMQEGSIRFLLNKYNPSLFIQGYNDAVQKGIFPLLNLSANIHILDCTDLEVNYFNSNYENSGISHSKKDNSLTRGYKLATLRGIIEDTGLIEEIRFDSINIHDLKLSEEMLKTTSVFKENDILINDRGFLSNELITYLKKVRKVDTYVPLKKNMEIYQVAVSTAQCLNQWEQHPNKKRKTQVICLINDLEDCWNNNSVPINCCIVWDKEIDDYFVFATTDISKKAKEIIKIYELRTEVEEDYRQLKDFWKIEDFKSTKINVILFHIVCVLFGYLFFQIYTLSPQGIEYLHKSLPVILKRFIPKIEPYIVLYVEDEFGILTLLETLELYAHCDEKVRNLFKKVLEVK